DKEEAIKKYTSLVKWSAKKFQLQHCNNNNWYELEDFVSVGFIGLLESVEKYKKNKDTKFSTFARDHIWRTLIDDYRKRFKTRNISDSNILNINIDDIDLEKEESLIEENVVKENIYKKQIYNIILSAVKDILSEQERKVFSLIHLKEGCTQTEAANKLDLTQGRISQIRDNAIKKIKKYVKDRDFS
ncbi:MAG TPA: sigma-70 family RNA polymerase sigma factor, partial [Candidatus Paceibacterota bacterium]|nr:sigma-70 family RNA polymerase sigma factor [Candidatus Paceibacterota bacterium]